MRLLLLLPLAGARAGEFSKAPALDIPTLAAPQLPNASIAQPQAGLINAAALPPAQLLPAAVAQKTASVAQISQAQNADPRSQGDLIEQILEDGPRQQLVAAGFEPGEADIVLGRVDRRVTRIESVLKERSDPWLEHSLKSAWLLSVLTGARPAALFHFPAEEIEPLRSAVAAVNSGLKVAQVGKPGTFPYVLIYDPAMTVQAMRRSASYDRPSVSFARELRKLERSPAGPAVSLEQWLPRWLRGLPARADDRVGVLLGYPLNDVADIVENRPPPEHCGGPSCVTVNYGGDENNGVFWLTLDPSHPETRKTEALLRVSLDAASKRIGEPPRPAPPSKTGGPQ